VNLKYALGEVETYRGSHHGGRFLFCGRINNDHTMAHSTPDTGAVHPISLTLKVLHFDGYKPLVEQAFYEATIV